MPTVEFIDASSIVSQSRRLDMVSRLVSRSRIDESDEFELSAAEADTFIQEALLRHNDDYTWTTLPRREEQAVILLAWRSIILWRMSQVALQFGVDTDIGSANPGARYDSLADLAETLKDDYEKLCEDLSVGSFAHDSITVGDLVTYSDRLDALVPYSLAPAPEASVLSYSNPTSSTIDLVWSKSNSSVFYHYRVFFGTTSGLEDMTSLNDSESVYKGVNDDKATLLKTIEDAHFTSIRVSDLSQGTAYYFVIVTEDTAGKVAVSNEVEIVL